MTLGKHDERAGQAQWPSTVPTMSAHTIASSALARTYHCFFRVIF